MQFSLSKFKQYLGFSKAVLVQQVEEHKYFLNETVPYEMSMEEAFDSWNQNVFVPLVYAIEESGLDRVFPEIGENALFVRVSEHWNSLRKNHGDGMTAQQAVNSFASHSFGSEHENGYQ